MTYKLNPAIAKIALPVTLVVDGEQMEFENGKAAAEATFDQRYAVASIRAVGEAVEIELEQLPAVDTSWGDSASLSFF
jgi:hypothetical protein